jgi:hypothetical protein
MFFIKKVHSSFSTNIKFVSVKLAIETGYTVYSAKNAEPAAQQD